MEFTNRMKELTQNILSSSAERAEELTKLKEETSTLLQDFHDSRRKSGEKMRKELAEGRKLLVQSGKQLHKDLAQDEKKRKQEVGKMLEAFQSSRQESGAELRKELAEGKAKMKADVEVMRKGLQADLKGAADAWKEMPSTIGIKTSGRKITKETAIETPPNLEEKLLAIINQHVEGITLPEVAKELGIVTIVLGKAAKALLEQGKVRKEEKTYFPVII